MYGMVPSYSFPRVMPELLELLEVELPAPAEEDEVHASKSRRRSMSLYLDIFVEIERKHTALAGARA